jgi:ABC-type antimicrobial peptide transport system permease subunit
MSNSKKIEPNQVNPPRWATRLLHWYCKPELLEDLEGDLNEYFQRNTKSKGKRKAKLIYIIDVMKFFRLYTVRKPEFVNLIINWIMLSSYIKTSGRNLVRNKLFSSINIIGLSISMSVGLLMIGVLSDIFSYDKFHENHQKIYRVISKHEYLGNKDGNFMATSSLKAAYALQEFTEPKSVAIFRNGFSSDLKTKDKTIPLNGYWANEEVFKVFSFKLMKGNPATALKQPYSMVLTQASAKKLFGNEEALGKTVVYDKDKEFTITGIAEDIPKFSHIKFEMLGSLSTYEKVSDDYKNEMLWDNVWSTWVYLLLPENTNLNNLKTNLNNLSTREDKTVKNVHVQLDLQPMDQIMTGDDLGNQIGPVMGSSSLWIFGGLSFVVILSACFNYTNLSIARALRRTREVGIRKVIGALKSHVMGQFIVEAVLISICSLLVSLVLFIILRPYFLSIEESMQSILTLELSPLLILYFVLFSIIIGCTAGLFPAIFFSRINAVQVLKDLTSSLGFKKLTMRRVLIVFQYCISIMFITSTIIIYKQYRHFVAFDLGFKTENILNITTRGNKVEELKRELSELPEVKGISQSVMITSVGNYWGTYMKNPANPNDSAMVYYNTVDENYLPLHEHQLLAGRNFSSKLDSSETEIIVNESVIKYFNLGEKNPAKVVDEIVKVNKKDVRIVGVMKDFRYGRANGKMDEKKVIFRYSNKDARVLNVKVESSDLLQTYSKMEAIWKKIDAVHPFEARFYNESIEQAFAGLKAAVKMAGFLAVLAICIASMGLLGMVVFTTETRLKEISIRKVLGASEAGLIYLLGRGFILLLAVSAFIALPVTYLFFDQILFPEIANHAPLSFFDFFTGVAFILLIATLMIGTQTLKVARSNPAEILKTE